MLFRSPGKHDLLNEYPRYRLIYFTRRRYFALKVCVADADLRRELDVLRRLPSDEERHVPWLHDSLLQPARTHNSFSSSDTRTVCIPAFVPRLAHTYLSTRAASFNPTHPRFRLHPQRLWHKNGGRPPSMPLPFLI